MSSPDKDKESIKENLLRQGVSSDEIQKVYRTLRDKGYGEEEARTRSQEALQRLKQLREMEERRRADRAERARAQAAASPEAAGGPSPKTATATPARRAMDRLPVVPSWLRRRINRYAYANGFLITRFAQLFDDFLSLFDARRPDVVSRSLLGFLADERGFRGRSPRELSFVDTLDALMESAARLLGQRRTWSLSNDAEEIQARLRAREPFVVEFLSAFTQPHEALRKSLEYLGTSFRLRRKVRVGGLARVVKDGLRWITIVGALEPDRLVPLLDLARDVNLEVTPGAREAGELLEADSIFQGAFSNLERVGHELYPALLKMIAAFYTEEDTSPEKAEAIRAFLGVREEDLLSWEAWQQRMQELRERELKERQAREVARLEQEKKEAFSARFEGTLTMLSSLFPDSRIERIEQGEFVLPYFTHRVFAGSPVFQARAADLESLSAQDTMGTVLVLHSLIDDLLSSVDSARLETLVGREGYAGELFGLRDQWRECYPRIFEPYVDAVREVARETGGDPRYAEMFRSSPRARMLVERIEELRTAAIRGIGRRAQGRDVGVTPIYELGARLSELLTEAGMILNQSTLSAEDPVSRKLMEDLGRRGFVDFPGATRPGTVGYHPVTRQVRRWVEARHREDVLEIPQKAQVAFLDVLRGVAYLFEAFLNDAKSPAALVSRGAATATSAEHAAWNKERSVGSREAQKSLQATLREPFPGRYLDALTGLKNKDYFLNELPGILQELRTAGTPITLLLLDVDHFKWVNDSLGHSRGDEVLKATAAMILDSIREGDLAVRYGGEEILVVLPSDVHTGVVLAERLRYSQEARVLSREGMQDIRTVALEGGETCGTLSIGVVDISGIRDLAAAVERADRALYAAKTTRNAVILFDGERFTTYAQYRARTVPADSPPSRGRMPSG